jgi:Amt family ammonium transporter
VDVAVLFFDRLKVDDPVGAFAVHGINGLFGTIAVGFFAQEDGLFFGGGTSLLITQIIGVLSIALFSFCLTYVIMSLLKITVGLECQRRRKGWN